MLKIYTNETKCYLERGNTEVETELTELTLVVDTIVNDVSVRTNISKKELISKLIEIIN